MPTYKVHRIAPFGSVAETAHLEADSDDLVIEICLHAQKDDILEIWEGERFVAVLRPPRPLKH